MSTTSGTIGSTTIDTTTVIDHAVRRCGLTPSTLSPENLQTCLNLLYLRLSALSNRGINLWCITQSILSLSENKSRYYLPSGTVDILAVNYRLGSSLAHDGTFTKDKYTADLGGAVPIKTVGMYYNSTRYHDWVVEISNDNVEWATILDLGTVLGNAGQWSWHDIDPAYATQFFRVRDTRPDPTNVFPSLNVDQIRVLNQTSEIPLSAMSRDTYMSMNNKRAPGRPTQFWFDKQVSPQLILNPEPNDSSAHLVVWTHRQIQDVGNMQNVLEIPERWKQAVIWQLAADASYELPGVEKDRRIECLANASAATTEAEDGETDGAPIYLQPKISPYTR